MAGSPSIVLGVTGSIAAYKAVELLRLFKEHGCNVHVILTKKAAAFISPLTFQSLSGKPVRQDLFSFEEESKISHIEMAQQNDALVIAPASANFIAKAAVGLCDDLLSTVFCAANIPTFISPAMNTVMWESAAVRHNLALLSQRGYRIIEPASGYLACDTIGKGRLPDPSGIFETVMSALSQKKILSGTKLLISAGPTIEKIDDFRFISNYSTGRMGFALADCAAKMGADVTLVSGPTSIDPPANVTLVKVTSADDMYDAVMHHFPASDILIKAAAVSDYTPAVSVKGKIKKGADSNRIELKRTKDILLEAGKQKTDRQVTVGFAAESENLETYAGNKLSAKNADLIVGNYIGVSGSGFASENNKIILLEKEAKTEYFENTKALLAELILQRAFALWESKSKLLKR